MQHNATFEIEMSGRFHWRLFGIFWHRPLSAIITSAPQANFLKFKGYFRSESTGKFWHHLQVYHKSGANENF